MAGTSIIGKQMKVTLGANTVLGMGTWSMDGITTDQYENTELGDSWKSYQFGLNDGGQVTFSGLYKLGDTTGQNTLRKAQISDPPTQITNLRLYVNNTSYYEACRTTGYWGPGADSTGFNTVLSYLNVLSCPIGGDKAGLGTASFTMKISGVMVLV